MGSRALLFLKLSSPSPTATKHQILVNYKNFGSSLQLLNPRRLQWIQACSTKATNASSLPPPDVSRLAETARISLSPHEVEEFAPKIQQMIDWFGQLQAVDLNSVEPAIRADTEDDILREDIPETFEKRETLIAAVPSYEEPYIKVPKVLNKE